jgi:hypothetical protein
VLLSGFKIQTTGLPQFHIKMRFHTATHIATHVVALAVLDQDVLDFAETLKLGITLTLRMRMTAVVEVSVMGLYP